jgi:ribosomal protein S12 methylthiotransferase
VDLLERLSEIDGIEWIRLFYCYPTVVNDALIDAVARLDKVVKYIDVPLQHSHDEMLKQMKRQEREAGVRAMLHTLRERIPGVALRTTFITGFPGETEEHFEHMEQFVREYEFDHLGVFAYSDEPGTAAYEYVDKVDPGVAAERRDRLMAVQHDIAVRNNAARVGQVHPVLVEGVDEDGMLLMGRLPTQGPDIDGQVIIENSPVEPGDIVPMRLTGSLDYDLIATCEEIE